MKPARGHCQTRPAGLVWRAKGRAADHCSREEMPDSPMVRHPAKGDSGGASIYGVGVRDTAGRYGPAQIVTGYLEPAKASALLGRLRKKRDYQVSGKLTKKPPDFRLTARYACRWRHSGLKAATANPCHSHPL